jgi:predicted DsbA family dithiol-disulfide isomerase
MNRIFARAREEEPGLTFNAWPEKPMPSESTPALEAGCCAQYQGKEGFERFHFALFRALFEDSRDISEIGVLLDVAGQAGLDVSRLAQDLDSGWGRRKIKDRRDTLMAGGEFNGVPTAFFGSVFPLEGAVPVQVYHRAVERLCRAGKPGGSTA